MPLKTNRELRKEHEIKHFFKLISWTPGTKLAEQLEENRVNDDYWLIAYL